MRELIIVPVYAATLWARCLNLKLSRYQSSSFVCVRKEDSDEAVRTHSQLAYAELANNYFAITFQLLLIYFVPLI